MRKNVMEKTKSVEHYRPNLVEDVTDCKCDCSKFFVISRAFRGWRAFGRFDRLGVNHEKTPVPKNKSVPNLTSMLFCTYILLALREILEIAV